MWLFPSSCPITKKDKRQRVKEGQEEQGKNRKRIKKRKRGGGRKRLRRK